MKQFAVYFLIELEANPPNVEVYNIQAENKETVKDAAFDRLRNTLLADDFEAEDVDYMMKNEFSIVSIVEVVEPAVIDVFYWAEDSE